MYNVTAAPSCYSIIEAWPASDINWGVCVMGSFNVFQSESNSSPCSERGCVIGKKAATCAECRFFLYIYNP